MLTKSDKTQHWPNSSPANYTNIVRFLMLGPMSSCQPNVDLAKHSNWPDVRPKKTYSFIVELMWLYQHGSDVVA